MAILTPEFMLFPVYETFLIFLRINRKKIKMNVKTIVLRRLLLSWRKIIASDAGRDWGQEEKGMTEDEMAGWHHWLDGCESGGVDDGQGGLACCDSWGLEELDTSEQLNWTDQHFSKRQWKYVEDFF